MNLKLDASEVTLIDPKNLELVSNLIRNEIAFPDIEFKDQELFRNKTTLKAAYTTINKGNLKPYLSDLNWEVNGNVEWQNKMLNTLSNDIFKMIDYWKVKNDPELLTKIFIYIQLWGGNTSRGFFNINGFQSNFNLENYKKGVELAIINNSESLIYFTKLNQVGISFASKHMYFWSNKSLPIYDNIVAMIIFGRLPENKSKHYKEYVLSLDKVGFKRGITSNIIERSIFNWYETESGKKWFEIRKAKLKGVS